MIRYPLYTFIRQRLFRKEGVVLGMSMATKVRLALGNERAGDGDSRLPGWNDHVKLACESLQANKIIAVPTDTIYGIAGLAQSSEAVDRIYSIKNRNTSNPVAICVGDVSDVHRWGRVTIPTDLLRELLPGPVTVVFERTFALNPHLNPGTALVGIRVPDYGFVRDIARACGEPLALTSANPSSTPSTLRTDEFSSLWPQLAVVFDGGSLDQPEGVRSGSTVVDLSKAGLFSIVRPGSAYIPTVQTLQRYGLTENLKQ